MPRVHRDAEGSEPEAEPRARTDEPRRQPIHAALLQLQRTAGNAAVGNLIQRVHPAFNEVNYWKAPLPAVGDAPAQPAPGSPGAVMNRLRKKFPEALAHELLHTEAAEEDALAREPMTEAFIRDGGTAEQAVELLRRQPVDNAALQGDFDLIRALLAEGATAEEVTASVRAAPPGGLAAALHRGRVRRLGTSADKAFERMEKLDDARVQMGFRTQPPRALELRAGLIAAQRAAQTPGAQARADLTSRIADVEAWAMVREPTVLNLAAEDMDLIRDSLSLYGNVLRPLVEALFYREPYDQNVVDGHIASWNAEPPMRRRKLKTPQQLLDGLVERVRALWGLDDGAARPIGTLTHNRRAQATLDVLEREHVPKATWDRLTAALEFDQVVDAVKNEQTAVKLLALADRLDRRALTGANLTYLIANDMVDIPRGRHFPYYGGAYGPEIECELTATWKMDLWMPSGMRRWADIHIHYNGLQALQAQVRFVHLKFDRTVAGAGPNITGHALIADAYADGRLDPAWTVTP